MRNLLYLTLLLWASIPAFADAPRTFREAKKAASQLYRDHQITFYCGCDYHLIDGKLRVDLASCGYQVRKQPHRAGRVEWEHVVPAWWLGHQRQCWQSGGRKNCQQTDPVFNQAEADLHNLVPSIGEINSDRSNYRFSMIEGEQRRYGTSCFIGSPFP
jgi:deoxyribonuclease-1